MDNSKRETRLFLNDCTFVPFVDLLDVLFDLHLRLLEFFFFAILGTEILTLDLQSIKA